MKNIFDRVANYLSEHQSGMLATIIWTSGSTPAPAQSRMLLSREGERISGTIGGGCVEEAIMRRTAALENKNFATILEYELNNEEIESGLICGGKMKVLLEPIYQSQIELYKMISNRIENGNNSILLKIYNKKGTVSECVYDEDLNLLKGEKISSDIVNESLINKKFPVLIEKQENIFILEQIEGKISLFVFGGGHIGRAISKFASECGFSVTVIDDRIEYANRKIHPEAERTICIPFRDISDEIGLNENSYVLIVTRGHSYDEQVLEKVLKYNPKYIGMIGSKRKVLIAFQHLKEKGIEVEKLKNVFAPVGLDIGAVTVEEIAISIVGEMIRVRRKRDFDLNQHMKLKDIKLENE